MNLGQFIFKIPGIGGPGMGGPGSWGPGSGVLAAGVPSNESGIDFVDLR